MLKKTNHTYVFNRQHVFHNGKEMIDNSVLDEDVFLKKSQVSH